MKPGILFDKRTAILALCLLFSFSSLAFAPMGLDVEYKQIVVDYNFNESVTFEALFNPLSLLNQVSRIDIQITAGDQTMLVESLPVQADGKVQTTLDISQARWQPFSTVTFKYQTVFTNGSTQWSETYSFRYDDNRLEWKQLSSPPFQIYWDSEDSQMGQLLLKTAQAGLQSAREYTGAVLPGEIRIAAYSDPEYLRTALQLEEIDLVAGHADPQNGVILVSTVPGPGLELELERQLPHELSHILVHQMSGENFNRLPVWLVEGIATISELYPNSDYQRILNAAASGGGLLPMESLCDTFPDNPTAAYLAYAQSGSFVNFLYKKFGTSGLDALVTAYGDGLSCTSGLETTYGETFSELEYNWQQEMLGIDSGKLVFSNLSPYLTILFALILLPVAPFLVLRKR